jgi:hypothetical protein
VKKVEVAGNANQKAAIVTMLKELKGPFKLKPVGTVSKNPNMCGIAIGASGALSSFISTMKDKGFKVKKSAKFGFALATKQVNDKKGAYLAVVTYQYFYGIFTLEVQFKKWPQENLSANP